MKYPYDEKKFQKHLAIMHHEKYEQYEKYRVRINLKWGGEYPGHSHAILIPIGFHDGREELLRNTLGFITGNFQTLYEKTLEAMLHVWACGSGKPNRKRGVKSLADLHEVRAEQDFIRLVQINLNDVKDDIAVFSFISELKYKEYDVPEDGCEFVFDHDRLLFWGDGNMGEHIFDYGNEFWKGKNSEFV
ncbi:MAG: hypothetical protein K2N63_06965 [Lachnospiraceae bacterium]|nr:hypothetical protein [Lachnospiraceae bacterium]